MKQLNYRDWVDSACYSVLAVLDLWFVKMLIAIALVAWGEYGIALTSFIALVFVDLFTKWIALSYLCLVDSGKTGDDLCFFCCIKNLKQARRKGYIKSSVMKNRFWGKMLVYLILTIVAVSADNALVGAGESRVLVRGILAYLAITEVVSILENLQQAGVEQADGILGFIKSKFSMFIVNKKKEEKP